MCNLTCDYPFSLWYRISYGYRHSRITAKWWFLPVLSNLSYIVISSVRKFMLHVHGKYVVRGSLWVGRGSNAGGLGLSCRWAGAVMLRNHNFGQFCIIVNFPIMNHSKPDMWLSIWVMMLGCIPLTFGILFIPLSNMIIFSIGSHLSFMWPKSTSNLQCFHAQG